MTDKDRKKLKKEGEIMIVIHEGKKEIAIYADVISDGKTFFRIKDLDNLYQRFGIEYVNSFL